MGHSIANIIIAIVAVLDGSAFWYCVTAVWCARIIAKGIERAPRRSGLPE